MAVILVFLVFSLAALVDSLVRLRRTQPECVPFTWREFVMRIVLAGVVMAVLALTS